MKIPLILLGCGVFLSQMTQALPADFYKKEQFKRFVKTVFDDEYTIEKFDGELVRVSESRSRKNNALLYKYEARFINPVDGNFSYNNFYQINKNYQYKAGQLAVVSYEIGKADGCFIQCGEELHYQRNQNIQQKTFPACLSLFDVQKRVLKYNDAYVKKHCIPN